ERLELPILRRIWPSVSSLSASHTSSLKQDCSVTFVVSLETTSPLNFMLDSSFSKSPIRKKLAMHVSQRLSKVSAGLRKVTHYNSPQASFTACRLFSAFTLLAARSFTVTSKLLTGLHPVWMTPS